MHKSIITIALLVLTLSGCAVVAEKTNFLSDTDLKSQAAGALGYTTADITLVSRRTEGTNTYAVVKTMDNKNFNCIVNGGNLLTMGMVNPPTCNQKK